jgi:hypothetical protein
MLTMMSTGFLTFHVNASSRKEACQMPSAGLYNLVNQVMETLYLFAPTRHSGFVVNIVNSSHFCAYVRVGREVDDVHASLNSLTTMLATSLRVTRPPFALMSEMERSQVTWPL